MAAVRRAIVMVWDGMRPDFIIPEETPNLCRLAGRGVSFSDSHAVFPTVTRCNSASIATGRLPSQHGIPGNSFYVAAAEPGRPLNSGDNNDLEKLRPIRGGRMLTAETLAERVKSKGGKTVVVGTGTPGASLLLHPEAEACGDLILNHALFVGVSRQEVVQAFGPIPERMLPRTALNEHFTRMITEFVLPKLAPDLLYFWHTDPDGTEHARGVGHPDVRAAIRDADANLGRIIAALEGLGLADETAIIVTSDHGFSTVRGRVSVSQVLVDAGLKASRESTDVVVTGGFVYVTDGDRSKTERIVRCLWGWTTPAQYSPARVVIHWKARCRCRHWAPLPN